MRSSGVEMGELSLFSLIPLPRSKSQILTGEIWKKIRCRIINSMFFPHCCHLNQSAKGWKYCKPYLVCTLTENVFRFQISMRHSWNKTWQSISKKLKQSRNEGEDKPGKKKNSWPHPCYAGNLEHWQCPAQPHLLPAR